jgi:membrane protein implicated in regulation of membrane protease activity
MSPETPISLEAVDSLIAIKGQEEFSKALLAYRRDKKYLWICIALFIVGLAFVFLFTAFSANIPWPTLIVTSFRYVSLALEAFLLLVLIYSVVAVVKAKKNLKEITKKLENLGTVTNITSEK